MMVPKTLTITTLLHGMHSVVAVLLCLALVITTNPVASQTAAQAQGTDEGTKLSNDQLDSLVAPIALYPDPLLSQILVASTYPLEIVQLSQWMEKNNKLSPEKMSEEVKKQDWDPSIQALVVLPDLVKKLTETIKWTSDLGNAFLAQQDDVMSAVQRMRAKAKDKGNLKTTEQQKVETKVVESKQVIVIEPAKTEVVYVPSYDPVVVYGPPVYPYPPYPYPPPGYAIAGAAVAFGVGMMVGAAWHGGYGWNCGWSGGNNNITINRNNNYVNNSNRQNFQGGNRVNANGAAGNTWQHNPQHRGGAPYSNKATATKYGGAARGDSLASRQATARQNPTQFGGRQQAAVSDRSAGARGGNRGASAGTMDRGATNRGASVGATNRAAGGGDRIGNQKVSGGLGGGAFGAGGGNRATSMASSSRGASSMGGFGGGGGRVRGGGRRR